MRINKNVCGFLIKIIVISMCFIKLNGVRSECSDDDWVCDDGQCISDDYLCDGKVDCGDRSDEIAENCIHFAKTCKKFAFSCAYGACIDGKSKCNGVQDCADNSDELICVTKENKDFQGSCDDDEIQCVTSRECINSFELCDGHKDCKDGSDESLDLCIHVDCEAYGFRCGNGACISGNAKCNKIKDCVDGSDEAWALCNTPRKKTNITNPPVQMDKCFVPNKPELQDMIIRLHPHNKTLTLGSYVNDYGIIHIECKDNYNLRGLPSLLCTNGDWEGNFPICTSICDGSRLTGLSRKVLCYYKQHLDLCPKNIRPGTKIQIYCIYGYKPITGNVNPQYLTCLDDGKFDKKPLPCEQNCGKVIMNHEILTKYGIPIEANLAPWHVAIYENNTIEYIYTCSGSIVSPRIVLSAAHCFWDETNFLLKISSDFQIIAGKSNNTYINISNTTFQIRDADSIIIPQNYQGRTGQQKYDIAFIKLKIPLAYQHTIAAICIVEDLPDTNKFLKSNQTGFITGFGENNQLQRLTMTTLDNDTCDARSPEDYVLADDKFCIFSKEFGAICRGDSGGGFYQGKKSSGVQTTYSLLGIISNTPSTTNDCTRPGNESYVAITNLQNMSDDFKKKLRVAIEEDKTLF